MSKQCYSLLVLFISFVLASCVSSQQHTVKSEQSCDLTHFFFDPTIIRTQSGHLRGKCDKINLNDPDNPTRTTSVLSWLGVPYAQPPVGPLRFMPPRLLSTPNESRNATRFSSKCIQDKPALAQSEDCLYLNIYAPLRESQLLPVFKPLPIYFYVNGGIFIAGSGADRDPTYLVGYNNMIVITFNYRLGIFGFMHLPDAGIQGNMGFLDTHLALRWIHENAASFGGDPNKITLGGQSAGAFAAHYHLIYPPSWPYFRNLVLKSGSSLTTKMMFMTSEVAAKRADDILERVNCSSRLSLDERSKCIQGVKPTRLVRVWNDYQDNTILNGNKLGSYLNPVFHLVLNNIDFNMTVQDYFATRRYKSNVNLLIGNVRDEGASTALIPPTVLAQFAIQGANYTQFEKAVDGFFYYFVQFPSLSTEEFRRAAINIYSTPNQTDYLNSLFDLLGEHVYICPSIDFTVFYATYNKRIRVYRYLFDHSRYATPIVAHSDDLPFWFGEVFSLNRNYTTEELRFSKQMTRYLSNFVKRGDPNDLASDQTTDEKNPVWPRFDTNKNLCSPDSLPHAYISFKPDNFQIKNEFEVKDCDFWRPFSSYPL